MFVTRRYRCLVFPIAVAVVVPALLGTRCSRRAEGDAPVRSALPDVTGDVQPFVQDLLSE
ncbi:MAG: hypothetical protein JXQ75_04830 [Phycisphaerae bacterium]|nr:hypothetical protein [Phycisphaerae bacterium]